MFYIRVSLMHARPGKEQQVAVAMDDLVTFYMKQPGYIVGYKLSAADEVGDVGRITVWESEAAAEAAAQTNHVMSKRSELMPLIEAGSHGERSFWAEEESKPLAKLLHKLGL